MAWSESRRHGSSLRYFTDYLRRQPLVEHFSQPHIVSDGLPIYRKLQQDDQDSVRLLTVEDLIVIAKRLSPAEVKELLLRQIKQSISDKSWRVRYMAANHFNEVFTFAPLCKKITDFDVKYSSPRLLELILCGKNSLANTCNS